MTHVFVAPHADDVALSCGGLIASLRELGQSVSIITVYSGAGGAVDGNGAATGASAATPLTSYQREALGFGTKALWPNTEAFNRADIRADFSAEDPAAPAWAATDDRLEATQEDADASAKRFWQRASWYRRASIRNKPLAGQVLIDDLPTQGAIYTDALMEAAAAGEIMAERRVEDEHYAYFAEASLIFLDLPDAVFRGYEGDEELLGAPREDDLPPYEILRREIVRLEPQTVYLPLGVGNHVDHVLCREAGIGLLDEARQWIMPGPDWAGRVSFYEDFPYAYWKGFSGLEDLPTGSLDTVPRDVILTPRYADISDQLERKVTGITLYPSQLDRLFGGEASMASTVRRHAAGMAAAGGFSGAGERYWDTFVP